MKKKIIMGFFVAVVIALLMVSSVTAVMVPPLNDANKVVEDEEEINDLLVSVFEDFNGLEDLEVFDDSDNSDRYQISGSLYYDAYYTRCPAKCVGRPCLPFVLPFIAIFWGGVCFGLTRINFERRDDPHVVGEVTVDGVRCDEFVATGFRGIFVFSTVGRAEGHHFFISGSARDVDVTQDGGGDDDLVGGTLCLGK